MVRSDLKSGHTSRGGKGPAAPPSKEEKAEREVCRLWGVQGKQGVRARGLANFLIFERLFSSFLSMI